jgi:hypothetical protein
VKQLPIVILIAFMICCSLHGKSQVICWPTPEEPTSDPANAPEVCLQELCFLSNNQQTFLNQGFCGTGAAVNNPHYFRFYASGDTIKIVIRVDACVFGFPVQAALIDTENWTNDNVVSCLPNVFQGSTDTLIWEHAQAGEEYFLLIDGTPPDICSFYIDAISGVFPTFLSNDLNGIFGPDSICPSESFLSLELFNPIDNAYGYIWNTSWTATESVTTEPFISYLTEDIPNGNHSICVYATNGCDTSSTVCHSVRINPAGETFIDTTICLQDTFLYNGVAYHLNHPNGSETYSNAAGCDSIILINLDFYPNDTTKIEAEFCENDPFSINVNGTLYDQQNPMGIEVVPDFYGCDSFVQIQLIYQPISINTDTFNICAGDSLTLYPTPIYQDTIIRDTLPGANMYGCDSLIEWAVFVHPASTSSIDAYLCPGESVMVGDQVFMTAGIFQIILPGTSQFGCDSVIILSVFESPNSTVSITQSICAGDTLTIGETIYADGGIYMVDVGPNQFGCDSIVTLMLTLLPEAIQFETAGICLGDSILFMDSFITSPGTYIFDIGSNLNGCDSTLVLEIVQWIDGPDTLHLEACRGDMISIGGNETIVDTSIIIMDTLLSIDVCDSIITYIVTAIDTPKLDTVHIIPDNGNGSGEIRPVFQDTTIVSWLWSNGSTDQILTEAIADFYTLDVVNASGCGSHFTFEVPLNTSVLDLKDANRVQLVQNPISVGTSIQIKMNSPAALSTTTDLIHSSGHYIQSWNNQFFDGQGMISLTPESMLEPGIYLILIKAGEQSEILKLIVM